MFHYAPNGLGRGFAVEDRVEGGVVVHLELAVELETAAAGEDVGPERVEAGREIITLFVQHSKAILVAELVFGRGAVELF